MTDPHAEDEPDVDQLVDWDGLQDLGRYRVPESAWIAPGGGAEAYVRSVARDVLSAGITRERLVAIVRLALDMRLTEQQIDAVLSEATGVTP